MTLVSYVPELETVCYFVYGKYLTERRRLKATQAFRRWFEKEYPNLTKRFKKEFGADYKNRVTNTFFNNVTKTELFEITKTGYKTDNATTVRSSLTFVNLKEY